MTSQTKKNPFIKGPGYVSKGVNLDLIHRSSPTAIKFTNVESENIDLNRPQGSSEIPIRLTQQDIGTLNHGGPHGISNFTNQSQQTGKSTLNQEGTNRIKLVSNDPIQKEEESLSIIDKRLMDQIIEKLMFLENIQNCLQPMFNSIRNNNENIKNMFFSRGRKFHEIQVLLEEVPRLQQGLFFYKPVQNRAIDFLALCFKDHPLNQQIKAVSKNFGLDYLKSLYVVKELYIYLNAMERSKYSTFLIDESKRKETSLLLMGAKNFLIQDKKNLLDCYSSLLIWDTRPHQTKFCSITQELDLLWRCIHMLEGEFQQIQCAFFDLFLKYSNIKDHNPYIDNEVKEMKKIMSKMKISPTLLQKLSDINAQEMLDKKCFQEKDYQGYHLDLVQLLVNKKDIDFVRACERLNGVSQISQLWVEYLKKYVEQVQFSKETFSLNLFKGIYLQKIMKLINWNGDFLNKFLEQNIIKKISTISLPLAIYYLQSLKSSEAKIFGIKMLSKNTEINLKQADRATEDLLATYCQGYERGSIIKYFVNTILSVFQEYLKIDDFVTLETQISGGVNLIFVLDPNKRVYQSIRFFKNIFERFPSYQDDIQNNIMTLFRILKKQNLDINCSFQSFDNTLVKKKPSWNIIAKHLTFATEILDNVENVSKVAERWFGIINRDSEFDLFKDFFIIFADKIEQNSENWNELNVLMTGIQVFRSSIFFYVCKEVDKRIILQKNGVDVMKMFKNIKIYCKKIQKEVPFHFSELFIKIKQTIMIKIGSPLSILSGQQHPLLMSERLSLFEILIENSEQNEQPSIKNSLSRLRLLLQQEKYLNFSNLLEQICYQVKNETNYDFVELLQALISADGHLTQRIIHENLTKMTQKALDLNNLSFLKLAKIQTVLVFLHDIPIKNMNEAEKEKLFTFVNSIQAKVVLWMKDGQISELLFPILFDFFTKAYNSIKYEFHLQFLYKVYERKYFGFLSIPQREMLEKYGLLLISYFMFQKTLSVRPSDRSQMKEISKQIEIFTEIGVSLINHYGNMEKDENITKFGNRYFTILNHILTQCLPMAPLTNIVKNSQFLLETAIRVSKSKIGHEYFITSENNHENIQGLNQQNQSEIDVSKCMDQDQFNQIYIKSIGLIQGEPHPREVVKKLSRFLTFLTVNKTRKLKLFSFNQSFASRLLQSEESMLPFLTIMKVVLEMMAPDFDFKIKSKGVFLGIISKFSANQKRAFLLNELVTTASLALKTSIVQQFQLLRNFNAEVISLVQHFPDILFLWLEPEQENSFRHFSQHKLIIEYYPIGMKKVKSFSLWDLMEYREKLILIKNILNFLKYLNGLNDLSYEMVDVIIKYTMFVKKNEEVMRSKDFEQQMERTSRLVGTNTNTWTTLQEKKLSLVEFRSICTEIGNSLGHLGFELSEKDTQYFCDFCIQRPF